MLVYIKVTNELCQQDKYTIKVHKATENQSLLLQVYMQLLLIYIYV